MLEIQIRHYIFFFNPIEQIFLICTEREKRIEAGLQNWEDNEPIVIYCEKKKMLEIDSENFAIAADVQAYFDDIMEKLETIPLPKMANQIEYKKIIIIKPGDDGSPDEDTGLIRFATQETP